MRTKTIPIERRFVISDEVQSCVPFDPTLLEYLRKGDILLHKTNADGTPQRFRLTSDPVFIFDKWDSEISKALLWSDIVIKTQRGGNRMYGTIFSATNYEGYDLRDIQWKGWKRILKDRQLAFILSRKAEAKRNAALLKWVSGQYALSAIDTVTQSCIRRIVNDHVIYWEVVDYFGRPTGEEFDTYDDVYAFTECTRKGWLML